jgi:hypothetical protein
VHYKRPKKKDTVWGNPLIITGIDQMKTDPPVIYDKTGETFRIKDEALNFPCLFELTDLTGRALIQTQLTAGQHSISIVPIPKGIYIYRLINKGNTVYSGKIVK